MLEAPANPGSQNRTFHRLKSLAEAGRITTTELNDPSIPLAERNALAFELARNLEAKIRDLEERLAIDSVTLLLNENFLKSTVRGYLRQLNYEGRDASDLEAIIFLNFDVDDFKMINDTYGHEQGNQALVAVADRIREVVRFGDPAFHNPNAAFRPGGDEFFAILPIEKAIPGGPAAELEDIYRRISSEMEGIEIELLDKNGNTVKIPIKVSVGKFIVKPGDKVTVEEVLHIADTNMYEEKRRGKEDRRSN